MLARQGERALSIAPEAGNERLRRHINKKVSDAMLDEKARLVFARGFTRLKLYLQVGLPSETDEDVRDIVRLAERLHGIAVEEGRRLGRVAEIVPSVNAFIPKPHTPYEDQPLAERTCSGSGWDCCSGSSRGSPTSSSAGCPWARPSGRRSSPRSTSRAPTSSRRPRRAFPSAASSRPTGSHRGRRAAAVRPSGGPSGFAGALVLHLQALNARGKEEVP